MYLKLLRVKDLSLAFSEDKSIFKNISFEIEKNTINLITGNSG